MIIKYKDHIPIGNYKDTTVFYDEETGVLLHGRQVGYNGGCGKSLLSTGSVLLATIFLRTFGKTLSVTGYKPLAFTYLLSCILSYWILNFFNNMVIEVNTFQLNNDDLHAFLLKEKKNVRILYLTIVVFGSLSLYYAYSYLMKDQSSALVGVGVGAIPATVLYNMKLNKRRKAINKLLKEMQS